MLVGALVQSGDDVCAAGVEMVVGKLVVGILLIAHYLVGLLAVSGQKVLVVCVQIDLFER